MALVALCHKTGWTWTELMSQPQWFIDNMMALVLEEARVSKKK